MVFNFSGTGNSLYAARKIASQLDTELISIREAIARKQYTFTLKAGESIGFIFPTYFFGIPAILKDFLSGLVLNGERDPYIFLVLTCGATTGNAVSMFRKKLKGRGYALSAAFSVVMPDNYVLLYDVLEPKRREDTLLTADVTLDRIVNQLKQKEYGDFDDRKGKAAPLVTAAAYQLYRYGRRTAKFYAKDTCTKCGLCQRICPSGTIVVKKDGPVWQKKQCIHCLGCIHRCPAAAIQFGKATEKRSRYVNPKVKLPVGL
jgi:NAD-dependent dihydropyrimidine dehydrogenase PreA subunit